MKKGTENRGKWAHAHRCTPSRTVENDILLVILTTREMPGTAGHERANKNARPAAPKEEPECVYFFRYEFFRRARVRVHIFRHRTACRTSEFSRCESDKTG